MKKIGLTLLVALCGTYCLAQQNKLSYGLKAGINISTINYGDPKSKTGFVGGAFANYKINESISIQPEVLYSMQGYTSTIIGDFEGSAVNYKDDTKLHYLNIPIMLRYNYKGIFAEVGPQFGINLRNTLDYEVELDYYGNNVTFSDRLKDIAKTFDFGVGVGLGYEIPKTNLNVNARYMSSLTSFYTDAGTTSGGYQFVDNESGSPKNRVLSFSLGYKF